MNIPRQSSTDNLQARLRPTKRELEVLQCAARGLDGKAIGRELFIESHTVKYHKTNLFRKLGAKTIGHAISIGYRRGLLRLEGDLEQYAPIVIVDGVVYEPVKKSQ